jgi:protease I
MAELTDCRVAVIATDGFEEAELTEPVKALRDAGADVMIVAPRRGEIQGFKHDTKGAAIEVDVLLQDVHADEFDAVVLPGGALNADALRMVPEMQTFLQAMQAAGKPMAAICHAPWELISAGLVKDRTLTSYHTIQDDIRNAGAEWVDRETVVDDNWVTSRQPSDLPAFNQEIVKLFARSLPAGRR